MDTQTSLNVTQFFFAVGITSFATFLGTAAVEYLKNRSEKKGIKESYKLQLAIEFEQISKLITKIKAETKARQYIPLFIVNLLQKNLERLESQLNNLYLIYNYEIQQKISEIISDCNLSIVEIHASESGPFDKGLSKSDKIVREEIAKEQRPQHKLELSDLQRRIDDLVNILKSKK